MISSHAAQILHVSAFTIAQALCSTAVALIVGVTAAFFTARRQFFGKRFLLSLSSVPLCIPSLLIALGFVSFFGMSGTLNTLLKALLHTDTPPLTFLYSFSGIIIAHGFYNFPLVMSNVYDAWSTIPQEQAEAARLLGARESRIFTTVTLFQLLPAIVSSCMLVFLYCFFSFMIVLLFGSVGCSTLEVEIYKSARATLNIHDTITLSLIETGCACLFVALYASLEKKSSRTRGMTFAPKFAPHALSSKRERLSAVLFFCVILLFFIAPLASIFYNAISSARTPLTVKTLSTVFSLRGFGNALFTTVLTALATSTLAVLIAFFYAVFVRRADARSTHLILRIIPMIPMAISSVVLALIIMSLVHRGNPIHLILAQTFLSWPLAFRQIHAALSKLSEETLDAARLLSKNPLHTLTKIYLPYASRGMFSAFGFCFAVSAGDTTLPLVMAIPHFDTLALFTYRLASSYRFHEGCAAGVILGVLCMSVFSATQALKRK